MVQRLIDRALRFYESLQKRKRPISEDTRKKRTASILIACGTLLGLWAQSTSTTEARIGWLKEHPPSDEFWWKTLKERGFISVTDSQWWERSAMELPNRKPNTPSVWISENHRLFLRYAANGWEAWGLQESVPQKPDRHLWEALGYGWDAVDLFVNLNLPITRTNENRAAPPEWRDPRSVQY